MGISQKGAEFLTRSRIAEASRGDVDALFELGVTYSTGRGGTVVDLVEAHKWFNLAALQGCTRGPRLARNDDRAALRRLTNQYCHSPAVLGPGFLVGAGRDRALLAPAGDQKASRRHALR